MPVGLTLKAAHKRYPAPAQGELMLIHRCTECGAVSINRIAADDDCATLLEVFDTLAELAVKLGLDQMGINPLRPAERALVEMRLLGRSD
jgi:hypothetical protein